MTRNCFVVCIALLSSFALTPSHAYGQNDQNNAKARRVDRERRKVQVNAKVDGVGISSGLVVVYGHPIPKPYHIEYRGNLLFVNDIQVGPSLVQQRELDKTKHDMTPADAEHFGDLQGLTQRVRKIYFEKQGKLPGDELRNEVLAIVRKHPRIKDAEWSGDMILYHAKGAYEAVTNAISFLPRSARADAKPNKSQAELRSSFVKELEDHLKKGGCLFWGTVGLWRSPAGKCERVKVEIAEVMDKSNLSDDEKERRLREVFGGAHDEPLDVMSNYESREWK